MKWDRTVPCPSCPYRRDAPRGLWHRSEFENLLKQDADSLFGGTFRCHEFNKQPKEEHRPCAGWMLDQKKRGVPSIQLRLMLTRNPEAVKCFNKAKPNGVPLFDSIEEMCRANIERIKHVKPKEYEIFKIRQQMYGDPTGLVVIAQTKKEAMSLARKKLGPGTYNAVESTAEQREARKKAGEEIEKKLAKRRIPVIRDLR
jgi:hypothetical protein